MTIALRRATDADFAAIRAVAWRSWESAYGAIVPEPDRREFFAHHYAEDGHRRGVRSERTLYLVAEDSGTAVAFLLASHDADVVHLHRLYADPERWRRGAGQALWDELVRWSRGRVVSRIAFEVATEGVSGPRFYLKQGCRAVAETVMPVGGTPVRVTRCAYDLVSRASGSP